MDPICGNCEHVNPGAPDGCDATPDDYCAIDEMGTEDSTHACPKDCRYYHTIDEGPDSCSCPAGVRCPHLETAECQANHDSAIPVDYTRGRSKLFK